MGGIAPTSLPYKFILIPPPMKHSQLRHWTQLGQESLRNYRIENNNRNSDTSSSAENENNRTGKTIYYRETRMLSRWCERSKFNVSNDENGVFFRAGKKLYFRNGRSSPVLFERPSKSYNVLNRWCAARVRTTMTIITTAINRGNNDCIIVIIIIIITYE
jgi:hypothetical protein